MNFTKSKTVSDYSYKLQQVHASEEIEKSKVAAQIIARGEPWTDEEFPPQESSLFVLPELTKQMLDSLQINADTKHRTINQTGNLSKSDEVEISPFVSLDRPKWLG